MPILLFALLLAAPSYDLKEGTLTYTLVHKLHQVKGTTHTIEGRAVVQPGGALQVQVRTKVASFDSGNSNRDEHMREATHEPLHPYVQIKGSAKGVPRTLPADIQLDAIVDFGGVQKPEKISVHLEQRQGGIGAKFSFPLSLDAFGIERPELLLVKVEDKLLIDGDLLFTEAKP